MHVDVHLLVSNAVFHVSLMPVSHVNTSPKKGNRLLLDHGFSESVLSNCTADLMMGL